MFEQAFSMLKAIPAMMSRSRRSGIETLALAFSMALSILLRSKRTSSPLRFLIFNMVLLLSIKKLSYSYIAVLSSRNILLLPGT